MDFSSLAAAAMAPQELGAASSLSASLPSDIVAERFNAMMSVAPTPAVSMHVIPSNYAVSATGSLQEPQTLGTQILSGLNNASTDYAQKWKNVTAGLDGMAHNPSASSMLKVQSELLQVSLQYELVGKAVSRSTQNIDTLVRMS